MRGEGGDLMLIITKLANKFEKKTHQILWNFVTHSSQETIFDEIENKAT